MARKTLFAAYAQRYGTRMLAAGEALAVPGYMAKALVGIGRFTPTAPAAPAAPAAPEPEPIPAAEIAPEPAPKPAPAPRTRKKATAKRKA